jgi:hypothetical protein
MDKPEQSHPYHRLQELLAIPERQRTEAEWDEINELEIALTPVNRADRAVASERGMRRKNAAPTDQPKPREGLSGRRTLKKLRKRPKSGAS